MREITKDTFYNEILPSKGVTVFDFFATWCGPCKMLSPILGELADEYENKVNFCKVNVDEEGELAQQFKIMSIPTLIFLKDGEIKETLVGYHDKKEIADILDSIINKD